MASPGKLRQFLRGEFGTGLGIIVIAALLVEMITIVQYNKLSSLFFRDLDIRSRIVLGNMADNISHTLELTETTMKENEWEIRSSLSQPDSMFNAIVQLIDDNPHVVGGCIGFVPYYYRSKGRLFEPYVVKTGDGYRMEQIGGEDHDYTQTPAFRQVLEDKRPIWSDPYVYGTDNPMSLTTYSYPIFDKKGKIVAVCGLDMDLSWLGDTLNARQPYPNAFALMLNGDGALVAPPPESRATPEFVDEVVKLVNGEQTELDVKKITVRQTKMRKEPYWTLVQVYQDSEVLSPLRKLRLEQFLWALAGLLVLFFMIERFARKERQLRTVTTEQARLGGELAVAKRIQMEMLPETFPPFPERKDLDIYGNLIPALEVGGDIFDFFIRDEKLFFCIGDVSGKGVPSAMLMSVIHSLFRMVSESEDSPCRITQALNSQLCRDNDANMFVTFFCGVLDLKSGRLRYCNAGHDRPLMVGEAVEELDAVANLPLGVFGTTEFEEQECLLPPGTAILLYTDGLTEAKDTQRQQFTLARVKKVVEDSHNMSAEALVTGLVGEVGNFTKGASQSDDMTLLAIRYLSAGGKLYDKISLSNDVKDVESLGQFSKSVCERVSVDAKTAARLRLALEEVVVNVMSYAYPEGQDGYVDVEAHSDGKELTLTVTDSGIEFDPTAVELADTGQAAEDRSPGGLGILLARSMMDYVGYERSGDKNVLTLKKSLI
ncbi:MAG: SpoIIE family protein phosphatase [Bacteroidales bacterium]|nr:SpoIIE family protein phosphatase [Bacteroidales bacterium]